MDVDFRIGTCSWADKSLLSSGWYPKGCKKSKDRLRHYSSFFDTVEADSFFYSLPDPAVIYSWMAATPPDFLFNVKAFALFTNHALSVKNLPLGAGKSLTTDRMKAFKPRELPFGTSKESREHGFSITLSFLYRS
ncbi:MAG: DUF72 domain-containing protein [Acetomicrobium sp.]